MFIRKKINIFSTCNSWILEVLAYPFDLTNKVARLHNIIAAPFMVVYSLKKVSLPYLVCIAPGKHPGIVPFRTVIKGKKYGY